ncbi:uncharacterized protein [Haliotis asinina]|uniref:uncharacterized protein n=1 Tax=Haliotis asinina TaxID=109174 RepID=UPI003531E273
MSHECWRYNSTVSAVKTVFFCSCGCCGDAFRRFCCDTSFCDPDGKCSGVYLSHTSVVILICVSSLILIGAGVALVLVCRMKKRPLPGNSGGTSQEKSEEVSESDKDYSKDDDRRHSDHPYYIYPEFPLPQELQIQKQLQHNTQPRPQSQGNMSLRDQLSLEYTIQGTGRGDLCYLVLTVRKKASTGLSTVLIVVIVIGVLIVLAVIGCIICCIFGCTSGKRSGRVIAPAHTQPQVTVATTAVPPVNTGMTPAPQPAY